MLYNNEKKAWEPAEGIRGMSHVQVYHHEGNNTFRIVGRSMTDQTVVSVFIVYVTYCDGSHTKFPYFIFMAGNCVCFIAGCNKLFNNAQYEI